MKKGIDANTVNIEGNVSIGKTEIIKGKNANSKKLKKIEKKIDDLNLMILNHSGDFNNIDKLTGETSKVKNEIEKDNPNMEMILTSLAILETVALPVTSVSNAVIALIKMIKMF